MNKTCICTNTSNQYLRLIVNRTLTHTDDSSRTVYRVKTLFCF